MTHTPDARRHARYAADFPVACTLADEMDGWTDAVVTQGHTDYCRDYGHALGAVGGFDPELCPRCGEVVRDAPAPRPAHAAAYVPRPETALRADGSPVHPLPQVDVAVWGAEHRRADARRSSGQMDVFKESEAVDAAGATRDYWGRVWAALIRGNADAAIASERAAIAAERKASADAARAALASGHGWRPGAAFRGALGL